LNITQEQIDSLNQDIRKIKSLYPDTQLFGITPEMNITKSGVSRLVFMDRYTFKDLKKETFKQNDIVVLTVKNDPDFPARGIGTVQKINGSNALVLVDEEYREPLENEVEKETGLIIRSLDDIDKPLEIFYEQVAMRVAKGLSKVEEDHFSQDVSFGEFCNVLENMDVVPAGRVLYGAGTGTEVTYFNCYVMPFPKDSRGGIGEHRKKVMEIMSRGGGVGTNGSTLRPRNALARGVNGKSSGSVSWMDDIARLTHLISQGGSRRGAQMLMLNSWHPDIIEFIISKMQNPKILRFIIETTNDPQIKQFAQEKLKFTPLTEVEKKYLQSAKDHMYEHDHSPEEFDAVMELLNDGGRYDVHNPEFLSGANISICLTKEFMDAVDNDKDFELKFPDIDNYSWDQKDAYDLFWHKYGDVRDWEQMGYPVKVYKTIKAKELWNLINICATYSAEPGIFFIDNANEMTNAQAYGQKVVATNPCGEQPLSPMAVCNLLAINLSNMVNKETKQVDYDYLRYVVNTAVRMGDNVIDATPYFLEENEIQALGERRIGLGVMGLHDLLIHCEKVYGSEEGNEIVDKVFETIAIEAYNTSIDLGIEKGSFEFLTADTQEGTMKLREKFINTGFMKKMPEQMREDILKYGIRNSHLLTVAPTGSTGSMIGCSTGLEPYFAFKYYRSGRLGKFIEVNAEIVKGYLEDHPGTDPDKLPEWFVSAMELAPEQHADVQCIIQRWIDSSISKTVNAPKGYTVEEVQKVYERLYAGGAKGGTVYVDGSRNAQVLSLTKEGHSDNDSRKDDPKDDVKKIVLVDTVKPLEQTSVKIGNELGDTCPLCRKGEVVDRGGCATCNNCDAQLRCGL
jgi:ribonucleoside-diphosphate reductase alpha chain